MFDKFKKKNKVVEVKKINENKNNNYPTDLGCLSYEYLKWIKRIQIENGNNHDHAYLYLLLYFACRTKTIISGKTLNRFDDNFIKYYLPTPKECQKYIVRDKLDFIDKIDNVQIYILLLEQDEEVIKFVCKWYGCLPIDILIKKYHDDKLFRITEDGKYLPIDNPLLIEDEEKEKVLRLIY